MNAPSRDFEAWEACPPGELGRMVTRLNARRRANRRMRIGGAATAATVFLVAIVIGGRGLLPEPDSAIPDCGGLACSEVVPLFQDYHDGKLDPPLAERVRIHLANCPTCGPKYRQEFGDVAATAAVDWVAHGTGFCCPAVGGDLTVAVTRESYRPSPARRRRS